jgi:hypothetical protein
VFNSARKPVRGLKGLILDTDGGLVFDGAPTLERDDNVLMLDDVPMLDDYIEAPYFPHALDVRFHYCHTHA